MCLPLDCLQLSCFCGEASDQFEADFMWGEKKLALELSALIEEKCKLLEKVSFVQKEYEGLESSLKEASFEKESTEAQSLEFVEGSQISEAAYENLERSKSKLEDEILLLEKS